MLKAISRPLCSLWKTEPIRNVLNELKEDSDTNMSSVLKLKELLGVCVYYVMTIMNFKSLIVVLILFLWQLKKEHQG